MSEDNIVSPSDPNKGLTEHEKLTLERDVGQKAVVHREDAAMDADWARANDMVAAIGQGQNPNPDTYKYHGSFVVHAYTPHTVGGMMFQHQILRRDMPEWLADKAFESLRKECMAAFNRKRPVKRSGF